ncbi:hypothetical protein [Palleronia caenipelagi]|uniref:DUF1127 domain-containing protein n=1 Tax=Palleronia caenipelagi TaxID=2489174 RepID=A0A547QB74_9RHOB|nr:hypothetical protein [Palleronia caenipelagi]TRD23576.1 hypothetical protein FEV53_00740 [Palleronia caenipelagi]
MAHTFDSTLTASASEKKGGLWAALSRGFVAFCEAQSRQKDVAYFEAKSDEELAAMGLKRADIVRHVFRDRMFL